MLIETSWLRGNIEASFWTEKIEMYTVILLQLNPIGKHWMHCMYACWINSGHSSGGAAAQNHHSVIVTVLIRQTHGNRKKQTFPSTKIIL